MAAAVYRDDVGARVLRWCCDKKYNAPDMCVCGAVSDDLGQKKNADTRVGQRVAERTTVCVCAQVTAAAAAQCTVLFS
jgi:hypothetical protein